MSIRPWWPSGALAAGTTDLRYALRGLRRQPAFAAAALVTLALGIGAATLMLTVARGALAGAVPFADADRLVHVWIARPDDPAARPAVTRDQLAAWRVASDAFSALEGYDGTNLTLTGVAEPSRLQGVRVTGGFLQMLGVRPRLGRGLTAADAGAPVVVVSHDFWRSRLRGEPAVVGRSLTLDGRAMTVVGVLPEAFLFAPAGDVDVWLPLDDGAGASVRVVGRLRGGVTSERAAAQATTIARRSAMLMGERRTAAVAPLRDEIVGPTRPLLLALGGAVALVLLVACANVASLFLARALARGREMSLRAAIGAGRARIVRQLLTESVLVAVVGGAAGAALAWGGVAWLRGGAPAYVADRAPFVRTLAVDGTVLGATLAVVLLTGIAFGLAPALHAGRLSMSSLGRRDGDAAGPFGNRARRALIVAEIALTTVLLVGAGLMTRSVVALLRVDPGFDAEQVATVRLALAGSRYEVPALQQRFFASLVERARALPGVRVAGAVTNVPLVGSGTSAFQVEGEPTPPVRPQATLRGVAGDYFRAMGIPIVAGRAVGDRDDARSTPAVVVSARMARRLFGGASAVGRRVRLAAAAETSWTIVGVAADVRAASLDAPPTPTIYYSHLQRAENRMTLVLRAADPEALLGALRREVRALDPALPVYQAGTMAAHVAATPAVYVRRALLVLLGGFALAATLLAAVGVYGVIAYAAARRTRELGVRAALGATRGELLALVLKQGATLASVGIGAGLAASVALTRALGALLYGVRATDVPSYGAAALLLGGVTLAASAVPARRASRVSPVEALRAE